jgi:lipopolysaccharide/colanic/teichoic acid biosynthesis glycosyltransferase
MYNFIKRITDVVLVLIALTILFPVFALVILVLSVTGEREIFYIQERVGFKNRIFYVYKFATMLKNSPNIGTGTLTLRNDPRVTIFGKYLRITKVNELPQIINVLRGEMSIVGPRPLLKIDVDRYPDEIREKIYNVKPGITGIGSLVFRDEELLVTNSKIDKKEFYKEFILPYKGALEMWYQKNANTITDFKIIFLTAWIIIFPKSKLISIVFPDLPERVF